MKTILTIAFIAFITLTTSALTIEKPAAEKPVAVSSFKFFRIHRQATGVAMSWSPGSSQAQHFLIERSYDGDNFETIDNVPCNGISTHKYLDEAVYPGYIHYRIIAVNADNSTEASPIQMIRIVQRK